MTRLYDLIFLFPKSSVPRFLCLDDGLPFLSLSAECLNGRHACENSEHESKNYQAPCRLLILALRCIQIPVRYISRHVACPCFQVKPRIVCLSQHLNVLGVWIDMSGCLVQGERTYHGDDPEQSADEYEREDVYWIEQAWPLNNVPHESDFYHGRGQKKGANSHASCGSSRTRQSTLLPSLLEV